MRTLRTILPIVSAAMCAALLIMVLVDMIWPSTNLFLNGFVKVFILLAGLISAVCGGLLIALQRRRERQLRTRRSR